MGRESGMLGPPSSLLLTLWLSRQKRGCCLQNSKRDHVREVLCKNSRVLTGVSHN